jgi:homoaconitate hydratase
MGSRDAKAYLASPAVVAESAAAGFITGPGTLLDGRPERRYRELDWTPPERKVEVLAGFPEHIEGRLLLLPVDNLNTDGIYGKDVTYRDDLTPEQMATYAMLNYDPEFQNLAASGDIIVSGRNFGTGSSREQAATALKYRGIRGDRGQLLQTYLRNANNVLPQARRSRRHAGRWRQRSTPAGAPSSPIPWWSTSAAPSPPGAGTSTRSLLSARRPRSSSWPEGSRR